MSFTFNGEVRLYYETFGSQDGEPVLLINGAGSQCIDFDEAFCETLALAGFRVIRFDPRDTGLSSPLTHLPARLVDVHQAVCAGLPPPLAYSLDDLADDAFAILAAAGGGPAHILGRSLGSAVAQAMALRRPDQVKSLTLVIAFSRGLADTLSPKAMAAIESETVPDGVTYAARRVRSAQAIGSPSYLDVEQVERHALRAYARGVHPGGAARHFAVGVAMPDLRPALSQLDVPTLVIHGALDRVVPPSYAMETAACLRRARLEIFDDMGHDGPPELQQRCAGLFVEHTSNLRPRAGLASEPS